VIALFLFNWAGCSWPSARERAAADYDWTTCPIFDVFFALMACLDLRLVFMEFHNIGPESRQPRPAELVVGSFSSFSSWKGRAEHRRPASDHRHAGADQLLSRAYFLDIPGLDIFAHRGYSISRIV
jgi:hypothetical protein